MSCVTFLPFPYLLAVRDLASHQQLLWTPVSSMNAANAIAELSVLVARHGAPLVLKSDNGSAFIAEEFQNFLACAGIFGLYSPPRTPRYNGSIEAGIGSLKTRTDCHAQAQGRPTLWTADDLAFAQVEANATARPQGPRGPTPDDLWKNFGQDDYVLLVDTGKGHTLVNLLEPTATTKCNYYGHAFGLENQGFNKVRSGAISEDTDGSISINGVKHTFRQDKKLLNLQGSIYIDNRYVGPILETGFTKVADGKAQPGDIVMFEYAPWNNDLNATPRQKDVRFFVHASKIVPPPTK